MWSLFAEDTGTTLGIGGAIVALGSIAYGVIERLQRGKSTQRAEDAERRKEESDERNREVAERIAELYKVLDLYKSERAGIYTKLDTLQAEHMECRKSEARLSAQNASQQKEIDRNTSEIGQLTKRLQSLERSQS